MKKHSLVKMAVMAVLVALTACAKVKSGVQLQGKETGGNGDNVATAKEMTKASQSVPEALLTTPEGETVKLSSLIKGKFTYIDVWATWCGPCCQEIPFLEKLVEKFKGNDKVQFLSISLDQDTDAWLKMLELVKPQWTQFIIQGEAAEQFSMDWRIRGIPRFIMINPDGTVFSADATRPSNAVTVSTIEEQIK